MALNRFSKQSRRAPIPKTTGKVNVLNDRLQALLDLVPPCSHPKRILVAEDNPLALAFVKALLDKWGFSFSSFASGDSAWNALQQDTYDLALVDLQMPGLDGQEVIEQLRRDTANPNQQLPVIALVGMHDPECIEKLISAGADMFITKPFQPQQLFRSITYYTQIKQARKEYFFSSAFDSEVLYSLYQRDYQQIRVIFDIFLRNTPLAIDTMEDLLLKGEWRKLERQVHKVAPTFAMIGMGKITQMAAQLEKQLQQPEPPGRIIPDFRLFEKTVKDALQSVNIEQNKLNLLLNK